MRRPAGPAPGPAGYATPTSAPAPNANGYPGSGRNPDAGYGHPGYRAPASRPQRPSAPPRPPESRPAEPPRPSGPYGPPGPVGGRATERDAGPGPQSRESQQPRGSEPSRPEPPRRPEPSAESGARTETTAESSAPAVIHADPGAPGGSAELPAAEPNAYGPDDPSYGPPSQAWYAGREREREQEQAVQQAPADVQDARGPFEPLRHPDGSGQELISHRSAGWEFPSAEALATMGLNPREQIREFYRTAEAIGPEHMDQHIEELLERQRQLISEYFKEADGQEGPQ